MHISVLISIALVLAENLVSAGGTLGFALGTKKPDGTCKYTADYETDFDAILSASGSRLVRGYAASDCNSVGSETLYRGTFTGAQLLQKINQVKAMFPTIKVGTADSWNKYADGTANAIIQGGVELL